jgi:hypothetical protein
MDFIRYVGLLLCTAFRHSASLAQAFIFLAFVILGTALLVLPRFGMTLDAAALLVIINNPVFYAVCFGSVILVRLLCSPYWVWKAEGDAKIDAEIDVKELRESAAAKSTPLPNTAPNALSINFIEDAQHKIIEVFEVGTIRRRLKLSVHNGGNGWLSNCRLSLERTSPSIHDGAVELESGFFLNAHQSLYCEFLYFDEKFPDGRAARRVMLREVGTWFAASIGFPTDRPTTFIMKATAESPQAIATASFLAFVEDGHLTMEKLD